MLKFLVGLLLPAMLCVPCLTLASSLAPLARLDVRVPASGFAPLRADSVRDYAEPSVSVPSYFAPVVDSTFGTRVTRIAGASGTPIGGGVPGTWGNDVRHHYSKNQPWNADGSLIALQNNGGGMILLDGETYQPRFGKCSTYNIGDDRWHPSPAHSRERISVKGTDLIWYDVVNCVKTRSWTLPFAVRWFGPSEGNPSFDGRFAALTDGKRMFVVDMDPQAPFAAYPSSRIGPAVAIDDCALGGECAIDWVSISPSGKYVVVSYDGDYPRVYDVNPQTLALTPRPMPESSPRCHGTAEQGFIYDVGHADMTLNPFDGDEDVLIGQEHCGNRGETVTGKVMSAVVMVRLRDGAVTPLTDPSNEAQAHHISTRNYDRPGWAYVGYHAAPGKRFNDEIVAVKLDGSKSVQRLAFKHSDYDSCYRCESHAVPSRDGRRVLWASNWASECTTCGASDDIKPYVVDARATARPGLTPVAPHAILADASYSTDPDGRIVSYAFDFGDGLGTVPQLSPFAPHIYRRAGRWNLSVTVTDDAGNRVVATQTIDVAAVAGNQPPLAALTLTPPSGFAPLAVIADGSASSDPEGPLVSYRFDFGDGTVETSSGPTFPHVYAAGTWTATLTVTDSAGAQSVATATVNVDSVPAPDTLAANLVGNPSFESNLDGWKAYSGASIARVAGGVDGSWCLSVSAPLLSTMFGVNDSPNWIARVPAAGTRYRISAFVRGRLLGKIRFQVREWSGGTQQGTTIYSDPVRPGLVWEELSVDVTALREGSTIDVQVINEPLVGLETFFLDNVSIRVIPARSEPGFAARHVSEMAALDMPPRVSSNPMFGRGSIEFRTVAPGPLRAALFDAAGREVRVLADEPFAPAGLRHLEIDGRNAFGAALPAGMYFYRVHSSAGQANGRFVLVR